MEDLFSDFQDVFKYLGILVGTKPEIILLTVENYFMRVSRDSDTSYVSNGYMFFDVVVINEVELFAGDCQPIVDLFLRTGEEQYRHHV